MDPTVEPKIELKQTVGRVLRSDAEPQIVNVTDPLPNLSTYMQARQQHYQSMLKE